MGKSSIISVKLKFLGLISTEKVEIRPIFIDLYRYNRWKFWKIFELIRFSKQLTLKINDLRQMDFKKSPEIEGCRIKRPESIDLIPFTAMIELQQFIQNVDLDEKPINFLISNVIAMSCFSSNVKCDFDSEGVEYKKFLENVLNSDLIEMMGLYQWIYEALEASSEYWQSRFSDVEVHDKDYEAAGGSRMAQFNVLNTIKSTSTDFNITYKEALQMSYGMTQANSLSKATAAYIQDVMQKRIESRMKQERAASR